MKKGLTILGHILFWIISFIIISRIFGVETIEITEINNEYEEVITYNYTFLYNNLIFFIFSMVTVYINILKLLPDYFNHKILRNYLWKVGVLLLFGFSLNTIINYYIAQIKAFEGHALIYPGFRLHLILFISFIAISFAYSFTREWYKNEQQKSQLQKENLSTELNFLKSQINPHFMFNTLNNLYSIAQHHNVDELTTGIEELSNLMRYMLYESNADFVPLKKEIKYIQSYIEIQQLRLDEKDDFLINFEKKGNFDGISIAPLILIPFIENAFKHGISQTDSSIINIFIERKENVINFNVSNKSFQEKGQIENESGIGLINVKRRLGLIYPGKHILDIQEENDLFKVNLKIISDA